MCGGRPEEGSPLCRSRQIYLAVAAGTWFIDRPAIHTSICMQLHFGDGLDEVRSQREWSPCRRSDTRFRRCFACDHPPPAIGDGLKMVPQRLELYPAALRWRRRRLRGCSFNVTVSRRFVGGHIFSTCVSVPFLHEEAPPGGTRLLRFLFGGTSDGDGPQPSASFQLVTAAKPLQPRPVQMR
jgi:hypothetical protein